MRYCHHMTYCHLTYEVHKMVKLSISNDKRHVLCVCYVYIVDALVKYG